MPNQNYFAPRDEIKMAQCDLSLSYPTCKTEERLCKISYDSWCPSCEKESPRKKSKSDTIDFNKRKSRESKKFDWDEHCEECENMDFECESKDVRYESCRIRSNLCELPTTYITNNCQTIKVSSCPSDFIDHTVKNLKDNEHGIRSGDFNGIDQNFGSMVDRHDRISKLLPRIEESNRNINGIVNKMSSKLENIKPNGVKPSTPLYSLESRKTPLHMDSLSKINEGYKVKPTNGISTSFNPYNHFATKNLPDLKYRICEAHQPRSNLTVNPNKIIPTPSPKPHLNHAAPKLHLKHASSVEKHGPSTEKHGPSIIEKYRADKRAHQYGDSSNIHYETNTFFDKKIEVGNLKERYLKEVELLKEKLKSLRNTTYTNHLIASTTKSSAKPVGNPTLSARENMQMDFNKLSNTPGSASKNFRRLEEPVKEENKRNCLKGSSTKISLKTKSKFTAAAKLKKARTKKLNHSKVAVVSDTSDSECSGSEDSNKNDNSAEESESGDSSSNQSSNKTAAVVSKLGSGDAIVWPVRPSLFPHVPPYLSFLLHDEEKPLSLPNGNRYLKWKLSTITPIIIRKTLVNSGFRLVRKSNEWVGTWGKHMKSPMFKTLKETQKLNHFPGTFQIGRKDRLWRNFQRMLTRFGQKEFGFLPQTYVLPQDLKLLKQHWINKSADENDKYIIKPPASARGTGIRVINKWSQLPKRMSLVVQEYISNPLLINGSKFDLRLYVLVTSFHPLRIYLYPEGLARFASVPYDNNPDNLRDRYMHLTNYSINKLSAAYTANEDANACKGHKWTITKLLEYLERRGTDTRMLWRNLQQLVIKTIISGEGSIVALCDENLNSRYNSYELFGIDVLLDNQLKCWLLEVNISPSLHSQSPLDEYVKGPLVKTLFELAQFHIPPRVGKLPTKGNPACYDPRIYTTNLTKKESVKHDFFSRTEHREEYLNGILTNLTGDDVRHLLQAEDEFCAMGKFERIFPTSRTYKYLPFMDSRYYNRLFDAWECKYERRRPEGIKILQSLCQQKVHLKIAIPPPITQSSSILNQTGDSIPQKSKEEVPQQQQQQPQRPLTANVILVESAHEKAEIGDISVVSPKSKVDIKSLYNAINMHIDKRNTILRPLSCSDYATHV